MNDEQQVCEQTPPKGWWVWFQEKAKTKNAEWWLGTYSFFETVILPFPTDPFLALLVYANKARAVWLTIWTTLTSLAGSVFLYGVTVFFYGLIVQPLVTTFHMQTIVDSVSTQVQAYTFVAIFIGAFSPLPYTPVVIAAGLFRVEFLPFVLGAFLGRGVRYALVTLITVFFGVHILPRLGRIATILSLILAAGVAVLYVLLK